jgi:hypothetical protein
MDLWVVNDESRRSKMGNFWGRSSTRSARIRGVLASPRRLSAHGVGPDGRRSRAQIKPFGVGRITARVIGAVPGRASRDGLGSWRSRGDAYGQWSQFTQQSQGDERPGKILRSESLKLQDRLRRQRHRDERG